MNEQPTRTLYRFLDHSGYWSRCGSLDYSTGKYEERYVFGEDEVVSYARLYDGKRNCFISRGARNKDGSVHHVSCITFDIDPIRPKGVASTHEQHDNAIRAGRKILSVFPGGYLCSSGNGCLLLYHCGSNVLNISDYYKREGVVIKDLQKVVDEYQVKIDATNYDQAVIKTIGTMSTKGEVSLRRRSRWIDYPVPPIRRCETLLCRLRDINKAESQVQTPSINLNVLETTFKGDRSTADFHLVRYLKDSGVGPAAALQVLRANPLGRKDDEKDQARLLTKIYGAESLLRTGKKEVGYFDSLGEISVGDGSERIQTGLRGLDAAIRQLPFGELSVVAARSGYGKSSFACTVAEYLRDIGKRILYFSTEMQRFYIMHKLVSVATGISTQSLIEKRITEADAAKIQAYREKFEASPITICDEFQPTLQLVQNKVLECKPDLIIFDHATQVGTHWEAQAQFYRGLKEIVSKENLPLLLLAELDEPPRNGKGELAESNRADVRGSKELLFLSALFMFITNPYELKGNYQHTEMHIAKNRYGISGLTVPMTIDKLIGKFSDREVSENATDLQTL